MGGLTNAVGRAVVASTMVAGLLCACSSGSDPFFATYVSEAPFGSGDAALLTGTLRNLDGCIVVEAPDGTVVVPVFPEQETAWGSDGQLQLAGLTFALDTEVAFGGGSNAASADYDIPPACAHEGEVFLVSSA